MRNIAGVARWPGNYDPNALWPHDNSLIWSGALWDLRTAMITYNTTQGDFIANTLIWEGLANRHETNLTFRGGLEGILQANIDMYSGEHTQIIKSAFASRGIVIEDDGGGDDGGGGTTTYCVKPDFFEVHGLPNPYRVYLSYLPPANCSPSYYEIWRYISSTGPVNFPLVGNSWGLIGTTTSLNYIDNTSYFLTNYVYYKVRAIDVNGNSGEWTYPAEVYGISQPNPSISNSNVPKIFALSQNSPNPFNPQTTINYALPNSGNVSLKVYSITGELVRALVNNEQSAGYYTVLWNGKDEYSKDVPSGIYFYTLQVGNEYKTTRKMLLMK
jgi:hypothetical protein